MFNGKVNNRNVSMSGKPNRRNRREVLGKFFFFFSGAKLLLFDRLH